MKMRQEHYNELKSLIENVSDKIKFHKKSLEASWHPKIKDIDTRVVWDMAYAAGATQFICKSLYPYLNDDHITTALLKIVREVEKS